MKKIVFLIVTILFVIGGAFFFIQRTGASKQETEFKFEVLSRGDIKNIVSSTGTLSAVGTVEGGCGQNAARSLGARC